MKQLMSSLILASLVMAPGLSAEARSHWPSGLGGHHGKFWKRGDVRRRLDLSEDQVRSLEQIFARNEQTLADLEADVKKKRADFDALLADDQDDDRRIMAEVDLLEQARANLGKARVTMLLAMRKILTPEQRAKLGRERERRERGD
jgi:Spy/CpxP family protein refolding chaperone